MIMPGDGVELDIRVSLDQMRGQVRTLLADRASDLRRMTEEWFERAQRDGTVARLLEQAVEEACERELRQQCRAVAGRVAVRMTMGGAGGVIQPVRFSAKTKGGLRELAGRGTRVGVGTFP